MNEISSSGETTALTKTLGEMTNILKELQINQQQPLFHQQQPPPPLQQQQSQQLVPKECAVFALVTPTTQMNVQVSRKTTPWWLPIISMTVRIKDTINKVVISTKVAITIKGVTTIIKVGEIIPTKDGGTIINKEVGTMEEIKDGTTTTHKTDTHKTLHINNQTKEETTKPTIHLIKGNDLNPTNHKLHKLPTLLLPPIKMKHSVPFSKDKKNFKLHLPLALPVLLLPSKLSRATWNHLLPPLLKLQVLVPYPLKLYDI
ncbi:hypothetical protein AHAS_Ahas06G0203100 [Arachis hypogaea]